MAVNISRYITAQNHDTLWLTHSGSLCNLPDIWSYPPYSMVRILGVAKQSQMLQFIDGHSMYIVPFGLVVFQWLTGSMWRVPTTYAQLPKGLSIWYQSVLPWLKSIQHKKCGPCPHVPPYLRFMISLILSLKISIHWILKHSYKASQCILVIWWIERQKVNENQTIYSSCPQLIVIILHLIDPNEPWVIQVIE